MGPSGERSAGEAPAGTLQYSRRNTPACEGGRRHQGPPPTCMGSIVALAGTIGVGCCSNCRGAAVLGRLGNCELLHPRTAGMFAMSHLDDSCYADSSWPPDPSLCLTCQGPVCQIWGFVSKQLTCTDHGFALVGPVDSGLEAADGVEWPFPAAPCWIRLIRVDCKGKH